MKTRILSSKLFAAIFVALLFAVQTSFSQSQTPFSINESPLPAPTGFVNDFAGVIDGTTKQSLETKIAEFKKTSNPPVELAVVTVKTTGDRPIFDYSLAVARGWGIGSKADDNPSALLLIAVDDRKYFTQISRDLEDELPDGLAGNLQRQYLVPEFKQGNYSKGISDTIDAFIKTIEARRSGETVPETVDATRDRDMVDRTIDATPDWICRGFCLLIIVLFLIAIFSSKGKGGGSGGSGVASGILWAILSSAASSGGSSSSGGWNSGGGSSGGWGGFGGGGDFGGGGAGGDW